MRFRMNPTAPELLSGKVDLAIVFRDEGYVAWTKTWEGPVRPDFPAAVADLRDRVELEKA